MRILHWNYDKTDNKHLRCTTSSVLGLFAQSKALKRSYPITLCALIEFKVWDFRKTTFFELAVCLTHVNQVIKSAKLPW